MTNTRKLLLPAFIAALIAAPVALTIVPAVITLIMLNPVVNPDDAHWAAEYHRPDFHSYMTAGAEGIVDIYPQTRAFGAADQRVVIGHDPLRQPPVPEGERI